MRTAIQLYTTAECPLGGQVRKFLVILGLAAISASPAQAQDLKLVGLTTRTERSVLSVLKRERCDPNWIAQALEDSRIPLSRRNSLPPGTPVRLRARSCKLPAPNFVAKASAPLLRTRVPARAQKPAPRKKATAQPVSAEQKKLEQEVKKLQLANQDLETQAKDLRSKLESLEKARAVVPPRVNRFTLFSAGFLVGALLSGLLALYFYRRGQKGKYVIDMLREVEHNGVRYKFGLTTLKEFEPASGNLLPVYRCLECGSADVWGSDSEFLNHTRVCPAHKTEETLDASLDT